MTFQASERRLQVFISSTYLDLIEERQAAHLSVLQLNHIPAGMELFAAGNDDAWTLISKVIQRSDVYLLIIGGRYGSTDEKGLGFTEREYDLALALKKPVLAFLHRDPSSIPRNRTEQHDSGWEKLALFSERVRNSHTCAFWANPSELRASVMAALIQEAPNIHGGWVRVEVDSAHERRTRGPTSGTADRPHNIGATAVAPEPRFTDLRTAVLQVVEALDVAYQGATLLSGMSTGLRDLDRMTGGLRAGELITVAGRPGMGKTALVLRIALEIAKAGLPILILSASNSAINYSRRLLALIGQFDAYHVFVGALKDDDWPRLTHAIQCLDEMNVVIDDSPEMGTAHIAEACNRIKSRFGALPLILIEDTHFVRSGDLCNDDTFGRFAKRLARQLDATVILTTNLPRAVESRANKRPLLHDIEQPDGLAEISDAVYFVYDDGHYNFDSLDVGTVEVIIARNSGGPIGAIRLSKWRGILGDYHPVETAEKAQSSASSPKSPTPDRPQ